MQAFSFLLIGCLVVQAACKASCTDVQALLAGSPGTVCKIPWTDVQTVLRPTQVSVGYAWVQRQTKDMDSQKNAQAKMDEKDIPVVKGPGGIYAVDGHHTLSALDFSGYDKVLVTLTIVCDYTDKVDTFWERMASDGFAYLYGRPNNEQNSIPSPISSSAIPTSFYFNGTGSTFVDDRWRSLAGFARKIRTPGDSKYQSRCMNRPCNSKTGGSIPFFEYRWAYFFVDAYADSSLWSSAASQKAFLQAYGQLPSRGPGLADVDAWQATAAMLLPLCRGDSAGSFSIPSDYGVFKGTLPGYHKGDSPMVPTKDPDCAPPVCPNIDSPLAFSNITVSRAD